ncbi:peptide-methionine (S)-S-oxide reductase MsrA [Pseudochelatococcus sp. B33]
MSSALHFSISRLARWRLHAAALVIAAAVMTVLAGVSPSKSQEGIAIPAPARDAQAAGGTAVAVLAGGCFWGVQGVFQHVDGVLNAVSGYAGGDSSTAQYEAVGTGRTGHAEAVEISFDPARISYGRILQIFFSVAHDPTQLNRQGPDVGTQYRTAIFPQDEEQAAIAKDYIAQLNQARVYDAAIVTRIERDRPFFPAEAYHQDFMTRNPTYPYIVYNDLPKVENLKRLFPERYREKPVLVSQTRAVN